MNVLPIQKTNEIKSTVGEGRGEQKTQIVHAVWFPSNEATPNLASPPSRAYWVMHWEVGQDREEEGSGIA